MVDQVFVNLLLNVGLLVLVASLLTKTRLLRHMLLDEWETPGGQAALAVLFGSVSILSTYIGIEVQGMIVNTRVIGVLAGGLLGGPAVGLGAAILASVHRFFLYDGGHFTACACSLSTLLAGVISVLFYPYFRRGKWDNGSIFLITSLSEALHMLLILLISRPLSTALELVQRIALPMILLNSLGMLLFVATFNNVFIERDYESAHELRLAFSIAQHSLPYLRRGLHSRQDLESTVRTILAFASCSGVAITDCERVLSAGQTMPGVDLGSIPGLPTPCRLAIEERRTVTLEDTQEDDPLRGALRRNTAIATPLTLHDEPAGTLMLLVKRQWLSQKVDVEFAEGLAALFSTQLELSELEEQKQLLRKAEFKALQSQVNPHFLYNALNTISCVCREDSRRARELIFTLSTYFRQTLENNRYLITLTEELDHVRNYLVLEQARFERKLEVLFDIPEEIDCVVPAFLLQPLVENAVRYGADSTGLRRVTVSVRREAEGVRVAVSDEGPGIPQEVIERLLADGAEERHFGLASVHKRLKSIYGVKSGLQISSTPTGARVEFLLTSVPENIRHEEEAICGLQ